MTSTLMGTLASGLACRRRLVSRRLRLLAFGCTLWLHSKVARISLVAKVPTSLAWLPVPADAVCSRELSWLHWFARLQDAKAAYVRVHSIVSCIAKVQATIANTD